VGLMEIEHQTRYTGPAVSL